jgi:threonylcarbamoyladenosine tRNA methylthiotransferase MtaB
MEGLFKQRGYEIVSFDQVADVYVINTCSVTHLGEKNLDKLFGGLYGLIIRPA